MAAYNKINVFVEDIFQKVHDLFGTDDLLKIALTNTAPVATNTILANITQVASGNGYTTGGEDTQNNGTRSTGTFTLQGTQVVWTAVTGQMGPFRYIALYNDTPTSPVDPLIAWWDHGTSETLEVDETFTVKFNNASPGDIFTLS